MLHLVYLLCGLIAARFKSRTRLEAENLILRHQLGILRRQMPKRLAVCTEYFVQFDSVTNPDSVGGNDRTDPPAPGSLSHTVPVQTGARGGERSAPPADHRVAA